MTDDPADVSAERLINALLDTMELSLRATPPVTRAHSQTAAWLRLLRGIECRCSRCAPLSPPEPSTPPPVTIGHPALDEHHVIRAIGEEIAAMSDEEFERRCRSAWGWWSGE